MAATTLVQAADTFCLMPAGGSSGPQLRFGGSAVHAGQFGSWTPIAAEAVSGGYQIAWQVTGRDWYAGWLVDRDGNYVAGLAEVSGSTYALQSSETLFQQDLNHDATTGLSSPAPAGLYDPWHVGLI